MFLVFLLLFFFIYIVRVARRFNDLYVMEKEGRQTVFSLFVYTS